ncbi:MAG: hypothetical protein QOH06_4613 [Acidobacteriota bacterium]|jgi:hypothetical protein|nr:hypothetical protein [Acidobacteriota bacterium]
MDAPEQEGFTLGKASRRKRERRLGLLPRQSHPLEPTFETPHLSEPLPGLEKISACLIELIRPYLPEEAGIQAWQAGIAMAAMAWNLALLPAPGRDREIGRMFQQAEALALDDPLLLEDLLQLLITRKLRFYPDDPRLILSWEVRKAGSRVHVTAMATLPDLLEGPEVSRQKLAAGYRAEAERSSPDADCQGVESEGL